MPSDRAVRVGAFVFAIFNYGLGLTLPAGLLKLVLPA